MESRTLIINIDETSGSHTVVWYVNGSERRDCVYTFSNSENAFCGHKIWDVDYIFSQIKQGIRIAYEQYPDISETKIKTWNYDYVLMCGDMELLPCYSYRDGRIAELDDFGSGVKTKQSTMSQILVDMNHGRLKMVTDILMMPEYFVYRLTGVKTKQHRNRGQMMHFRFKPEFEAELGRECSVAIG